MDFNEDLHFCLEALKQGQLVGIPGRAGWILAGNATDQEAMETLMKLHQARLAKGDYAHAPVILVADERDLILYVSALDLAVFDWIEQQEEPFAAWFDGVIGLADCLLNDKGAALITLVKDDFSKHLIKRFRFPLAGLLSRKSQMDGFCNLIAQEHTTALQEGYNQKKLFN
jgi:L-threonylcarbamoyladenylate synthase